MSDDRPMQMTEADAHYRHCPVALVPGVAPRACLGSQCMAWRWVGKEDPAKESKGFCGMCAQFPSR